MEQCVSPAQGRGIGRDTVVNGATFLAYPVYIVRLRLFFFKTHIGKQKRYELLTASLLTNVAHFSIQYLS